MAEPVEDLNYQSPDIYRKGIDTTYSDPESAIPQVGTDSEPLPDTPQINVSSGPSPTITPVSDRVASNRAYKAKEGLPQLPFTYGDIYKGILSGEEGDVRRAAASYANQLKEQARLQALSQIAASKMGVPMTPTEKAFVENLVQKSFDTDPQSVFEEYYAKQAVENVNKTGNDMEDSWWKNVAPEHRDAVIKAGTLWETKRQIVQTAAENADAETSAQGYPGWLLDKGLQLSQVYTYFKLGGGVLGLGNFLEDKFKDLWRHDDIDAFKKVLFAGAPTNNPSLASYYFHAMLGMSASEKYLSNLSSVLIPAGIVGGVLGAAKMLKTRGVAKEAKDLALSGNAVKTAIEHAAMEPASREAAAEAAGSIDKAAAIQTVKEVTTKFVNGAPPESAALEGLRVMGGTVISDIKRNPTGMRQELANRLITRTAQVFETVMDRVANTLKVERMPAVLALKNVMDDVVQDVLKDPKFVGINNRFVRSEIRQDRSINGHYLDMYFGQEGATEFRSPSAASGFAKQNMEGLAWHVGNDTQTGLGHFIRVTMPFPEDNFIAKNGLLALKNANMPDNALNALLRNLRTPEETTAVQASMARQNAVYGMSNYYKAAWNNAKEYNNLRIRFPFTKKAQMWNEFKRVVTEAKRENRVLNPVEFNTLYNNMLHRLPEDAEIEAYHSYMRGEMIREAWSKTNKLGFLHRMGAQVYELVIPDLARGTEKSSPIIKKRILASAETEFPTGKDPVLVMGQGLGAETVRTGAELSTMKLGKTLKEQFAKGEVHVLKLPEPSERPFLNFGKVGDSRIKYVVTEAPGNPKPIQWNDIKVGRSPDFDLDHWVVQPKLRWDAISKEWVYEGDNVLGGAQHRAMGKQFTERLNFLRAFFQKNDFKGAQEFLEANPINGVEMRQFNSWFKSTTKRGEKGRFQAEPSMLNKAHPMYLIPREKMSIDLPEFKDLEQTLKFGPDGKTKATFRDGTKEGYGRFLDESYRDYHNVFQVQNEGTRANPLFRVTPSDFVDPFTSLNRAMARTINSTFMNDFKIHAVNHWLEQAKDLLDGHPNEIRASPFYWFFNPKWKGLADSNTRMNLETNALQIKQFMGVQNKIDSWLYTVAQNMADATYEKGKRSLITPTWLLPKLKDPFQIMRSLVFDAKLGLFNPAQIWVQIQSFTTIWGIAGPKFAAPGTKAALMRMWMGHNASEEFLNHLDERATQQLIPGTARFKPGDFRMLTQGLDVSGFENIGGEYVVRNSPFMDIMQSGVEQARDIARWPFKTGERSVRLGAWYTAGLEFLEKNPTKTKLVDQDLREILHRADLLYTNMSRASAATWQHGPFSIPTQFLSYQIRLGELFMGKRLTQIERARLMGTYSLMYGVPGMFGLSGLPIGDYINKWATEDGYVVGKRYWDDFMTLGLPAYMLSYITGNWYNYQERMGVQGFEPIRELLRSDKSFLDVVGGAAFGSFYNTISNMDGFSNAFMSMLRQDGKYKLKFDDFLHAFSEVSVVDRGTRFFYALKTGKWLNKNNEVISDASWANALGMFLSGLSPQGNTLSTIMHWSANTEKEEANKAEAKFVRDWRRGLMLRETDPEGADDYIKRAYTHVEDVPIERMSQIMARANRGYESIVDRAFKNYSIGKDTPRSRKETGMKAWTDYLNERNKQKGQP